MPPRRPQHVPAAAAFLPNSNANANGTASALLVLLLWLLPLHFLLLFLLPLVNAPPTTILTAATADEQQSNHNSNKSPSNPWTPASVDQIRPYRLTKKWVHENPAALMSSGRKRKQRQHSNSRTDQPWPETAAEEDQTTMTTTTTQLSSDWRLAEPEQRELLEQIPTIGPHAEFAFLANQSLLHKRTPIYSLRHDQCLEVHFRVEGKRTRLLLYTCHLYEGGLCVLDKFLATTTRKKLDPTESSQLDVCHKLRPWMFMPSPFAFHFRFVRRPRKFADAEIERRHFRRRHGRHATREVGHVQLAGFHPCASACKGTEEEEDTELGDIRQTSLQDQHMEDPLQGWG